MKRKHCSKSFVLTGLEAFRFTEGHQYTLTMTYYNDLYHVVCHSPKKQSYSLKEPKDSSRLTFPKNQAPKKLAAGSFGVVFLAKDKTTNQQAKRPDWWNVAC